MWILPRKQLFPSVRPSVPARAGPRNDIASTHSVLGEQFRIRPAFGAGAVATRHNCQRAVVDYAGAVQRVQNLGHVVGVNLHHVPVKRRQLLRDRPGGQRSVCGGGLQHFVIDDRVPVFHAESGDQQAFPGHVRLLLAAAQNDVNLPPGLHHARAPPSPRRQPRRGPGEIVGRDGSPHVDCIL